MKKLNENINTQWEIIKKLEEKDFFNYNIIEVEIEYQKLIDLLWLKMKYFLEKK